MLNIKIYTPAKTLFDGNVSSISAINSKGAFDILEDHTNFITVIENNLTLYLKDGSTKVVEFDIGVLRLFGVEIDVYLGVKALPEQAAGEQTINPEDSFKDKAKEWLKEHGRKIKN